MLDALRHRGPDADGVWLGEAIGLGHTRLSIIDLAGGAQPMHHAQAPLTITFNGEIFNYVELRQALANRGHRFVTKSDTEVILHAYQEYGKDCVQHFNGQWAFAIWDAEARTLFLSRDRVGVRPLFYTSLGGAFRFASEVKALFTDGDVPRRFDLQGLDQVFTFWTTLPGRTVFEGIRELSPGHSMLVKDGRVETWPHWQFDYPQDTAPRPEEDYADELRDLMEDATQLRLRADVPVGAYLSGGFDSSYIASLVRQNNAIRLRTFSIGFEDPAYDETAEQQVVVERLGTEHSSIRISHTDIAQAFPAVVQQAEMPILRTAPVPMFLLSKLVRQSGFKVVLTGEGADEMFGGYDIFKEAKVRQFCAAQPQSHVRPMLLKRLYPYMESLRTQSPSYLAAFFRARPEDLEDPFFSHIPRWNLTRRLRLFYSEDTAAALRDYDPLSELSAQLPAQYHSWTDFARWQYLESTLLLPGYILSSQGDRPAMGNSVEGRYPFLDPRVVSFAAKLPPQMKMKVLQEKYILKRSAAGLLPESTLKRAKQPYRAPDAHSLFDPRTGTALADYVEEMLSASKVREFGIFNPGAVQSLVKKARTGNAVGTKDGMALVGILSTQLLAHSLLDQSRAH